MEPTQASTSNDVVNLDHKINTIVAPDGVGHFFKVDAIEIYRDDVLISVTLMPHIEGHVGKSVPFQVLDELEELYRNELKYFGAINLFDLEREEFADSAS
jgi:hypothetical protein